MRFQVLSILAVGLTLFPVSEAQAQLRLASATPNSATLSWSAPGNDGNQGTASAYDIRYSTSNITEGNWGSATTVSGEPTPQPAGSSESFAVGGLEPGTPYYFAIKTADSVPNWSALSNVATVTTALAAPTPMGHILDSANLSAVVTCNQVSVVISVYYQFALSASPSFASAVIQTGALSGSEVQSTYTGLSEAATYYWRCRVIASDLSDTSAWSSSSNFSFTESSGLPTPSTVGANVDSANGSAELISSQVSTPLVIYYQFALDTDNAFPAPAYGTGTINGAIVTTTYFDLANQTTYYWRCRVITQAETDTSDWSLTRSFAFNRAPSVPTTQSPPAGSVVPTLRPTLIVGNGDDPDNDELTYDFELYNQAADILLASVNGAVEGPSATQWTLPIDLTNLTGYAWRSRCYDGELYSTWTALVGFSIDLDAGGNLPPTLPGHASPANASTIISSPIILTIDNAIDPEDDALTYDFRIYGDAQLTQLIEAHIDIAETPSQTSVTLAFTPAHERTYWWQVRVSDGENTTAYTTATWFEYVDLAAGGEETVAGAGGPYGGQVMLTDRPVLTAVNAAVAGPNVYYFEVASDSEFVYPVVSSPGIEEEGNGFTRWQVDDELESGEDYYWRVRANDYAYSPVAKFHVGVDVYAAPNPVHLGDQVTFHLPDKPFDLLIQTVSGETVTVREGVSDIWVWNLNNAAGNQVAVGVYLWYLTGTDARGKIIVKP